MLLWFLTACPVGVDSADDCAPRELWHDRDGDGFGDPTAGVEGCPGEGDLVPNADDCDDADVEISPDAAERCDGADDDCNGEVDDGAIDAFDYYDDLDGDGYGDPATHLESCEAQSGYVETGGDCDDAHPAVNPAATELCNDRDDDCDDLADEDDDDDAPTWHVDDDADGHGGSAGSLRACAAPPGYAAGDDDCDDLDPNIHPGADEYCDGGGRRL